MNNIKSSCVLRIISLGLILTFISLDISYAYPSKHNPGDSTLAAPSVLQQIPVNEQAAQFQQSVFSQSALIASVYDIGEYFFGSVNKNIRSLPSKHIEYAIRADLRKHLSDAGTEILNIVPVEYIKKTAPEKLKSALDEIGFKGTLPDEGVVFILYRKGDKKFLVQIARKDQVSFDSLPGYEWVVSDKYVVKYMPENYEEGKLQSSLRATEGSETISLLGAVGESPKAVISEPIAEIEAPAIESVNLPQAPKRIFIIRAIVSSLVLMVLSVSPALAGESGVGANEAGSIFIGLKDFVFVHPIITGIAVLGIGITGSIALFFNIWRVFLPVSWHICRLKSKDRYVRSASAKALGEIKDPRAIEPLIEMLDMDPCTSKLGGGTEYPAVEQALVEIGAPAVPSLIRALAKNAYKVSNNAAWVLGKIKDSRAIEPLIRALSHYSSSVGRWKWRSNANFSQPVSALVEIGAPAVFSLIGVLGSANARSRGEAALALGEIKDLRAVKYLIKTLRDNDTLVREHVAMALSKIEDPRLNFMADYLETMSAQLYPYDEEHYDVLTAEEIDYILTCLERGISVSARTVIHPRARLEISMDKKPSQTPASEKAASAALVEDQTVGGLFWPELNFVQGQPIDRGLITRRILDADGAAERALTLLNRAKSEGRILAITGHLRGIDGPGSSLDLPEFQKKLTRKGAVNLSELPSTLTLASEFAVTITFEPAENKDAIEYIAPDYFKGDMTPRSIKGEVAMAPATAEMPWETTSQTNAPAYIFRNLFGLRGVRIICEPVHPMALAGGMESSNVFNVALIASASMLSGANLSQAEIFNLAVKLENNEFKGLIGGQGHLCSMVGGAYKHVWLSGIKDENGNIINPYSAFSIPVLSDEQIVNVENHTFLVQAGKDYEKGEAVEGRTASLINYMWTDLLRYEDPVGLELHGRKLKLADDYTKALQKGNFDAVAKTVNEYVDIRDTLCRRWMELVVDHRLNKKVPSYVTEYFVDKVNNPENPLYKFYEPVRKALEGMDAVLQAPDADRGSIEAATKSISFYTFGPIGELIREARLEGIAIMPLGAGGPGANLIGVSSKGADFMANFFESKGIKLFTEAKAKEAQKIIYGEEERGTLKGYIPFKAGKEPIQFSGFSDIGLEEPKKAAATPYARIAAKSGAEKRPESPDMAKGKADIEKAVVKPTAQLFEIVESSLTTERAKFIDAGNRLINSLPAKSGSEAAANIAALDKDMATAEIRQRVERAMAAIGNLDKEGVTPETKTAIELVKKNLNQFEADGAVGSLIVLARKAKKENQKLIIGLETEWIPGINMEKSLQRQAITALMKEIDGIAEALQSMGLDNVEIVRGSGSQLANAVITEADKTHTMMHNIVVMASANTINSDSFAALRNADESDRPFLTGIDPTELIKLYTEFGESVSKQLYIRLASLLYMTLELAAGKEPPQSPIIVSYDKKMRILILLPRADPIDYEALKNNYAAEKIALQAA